MLEIDVEFKKGILFVRLSGILSKTTVGKLKDEVTSLVKDNGIRNLVFNITNLEMLDMKGINELLYNYELCKLNKGISMICGSNDLVRRRMKNSRILKYMYEISDEMSAVHILNL